MMEEYTRPSGMDDATWEAMQSLIEREKAIRPYADALIKQGVNPLTATIMAGDMASADQADKLLAEGSPFDNLLWMVGSYARLQWVVQCQERGIITREKLLDLLPELWPGCDPDDTNPLFLRLWKEAKARNGGKLVTDEHKRLPGPLLTVYRGQMENDPLGIAWSLDQAIAGKFAHGAGARVPQPGVIYRAYVYRRDVLAYLTGRGEKEVIVDPADLRPFA